MKLSPIPFRPLGATGISTTVLGLGGAPLGRPSPNSGGDQKGLATLEKAYRLGLRHVDTSPRYGESEKRIGMALSQNQFPGLTVSTKAGTHPQRPNSYTRADLRWSVENSLKILGRSSVDMILIHDPTSMDPVFKRGDGFDALEEMRQEGKFRFVGLGVHDQAHHFAAIRAGRVDVILTYGDYNIVRRQARGLIEFAAGEGVGVLLGSPHMHGLLAETESNEFFMNKPNLLKWYSREDISLAQDWWLWCRDRGISLHHLNMRFVMENTFVSCVLTGAASSEEVSQNVLEAFTPIPSDVWNEAMEKIAHLDQTATGS